MRSFARTLSTPDKGITVGRAERFPGLCNMQTGPSTTHWPQAIISTWGVIGCGEGSRDSGVCTSSLGATSTPAVKEATVRSSRWKVSWTPRGV
jgi:hypothetical protein